MHCEILLQPDTARRGSKILHAMAAAAAEAGIEVAVVDRYTASTPWLMSYGLGHVLRRPWIEAHRKNGGRVIGWDLGYWNRDVPLNFSMRLTIDADHPHALIRPMSPERFKRSGIKLRADANPEGPIVLVGQGRKQRKFLGSTGPDWERSTLRQLQQRFGDKPILYRPKKPGERMTGCREAVGPIESVLRGASLVVCAHSNVAVDACIAGIPVECEDGAALALYRDNPNPTPEQRLDFLGSLAHWQWSPLEALQAWHHIKRELA
jgi:hypothetical protein